MVYPTYEYLKITSQSYEIRERKILSLLQEKELHIKLLKYDTLWNDLKDNLLYQKKLEYLLYNHQ